MRAFRRHDVLALVTGDYGIRDARSRGGVPGTCAGNVTYGWKWLCQSLSRVSCRWCIKLLKILA